MLIHVDNEGGDHCRKKKYITANAINVFFCNFVKFIFPRLTNTLLFNY